MLINKFKKRIILLSSLFFSIVTGSLESRVLKSKSENFDLNKIKWIVGNWVHNKNNQDFRSETWLGAKNGLMLGLKQSQVGKKNFFEYLRIEVKKEGVFYTPAPMGKELSPFKLVELGDQSARFTNPDHDFPKLIYYELVEKLVLHVVIEGEIKGKKKVLEYHLEKIK